MESFDRIISNTGIINPPQCWKESFEQDQDIIRRIYELLNPDQVKMLSKMVELEDDFIKLLEEAVEYIRCDNTLSTLAGIWHACLFYRNEEGSTRWPVPLTLPDNLNGMFPAVVLITGLPQFLEIHKSMGIPEKITRDCLIDMRLWADDYKTRNGKLGFAEISWLQYTFVGKLFRLKRLEFIHTFYSREFTVYRNRTSGQVLSLAASGVKYRKDGQVDGTNDIFDDKAWTSILQTEPDFVTGNPISSDGRAIKDPVKLNMNEWDQILSTNAPVLDVHIPAGEKMGYKDCLESFDLAASFYTTYFKDKPFVGFTCTSWLLDSNLQNILPVESNIVRFQKEFYLMPVLSNDYQTYERVFGTKPADFSKAPRDTSLRRAVLDYICAGNNMHGAFGFIPAGQAGVEHKYYCDNSVSNLPE